MVEQLLSLLKIKLSSLCYLELTLITPIILFLIIKKHAKFLKIKGPCCIQLKEDKFGELKLIEVNPRMGGGTIMATNAGVNFCELILKNLNKDTISEEDLNYDEITVLRYYEEIIIKK